MNEHTIKNKRIWELDVFRGFCILCVIVVHLVFDIQTIFGLLDNMPPLYVFIQEYGGTLFVILSGICVTLGSRNIKRGLIVAGGAVIITAVTVLIFEPELHIWFGILHLLAILYAYLRYL